MIKENRTIVGDKIILDSLEYTLRELLVERKKIVERVEND